ncbi:sugar phosphate isomerase/epimerase [Amycolatopsis sp. NPDC051106]|uniref:sugar phosphate isomerase/epimerase family protein n=1 Tax=unclassified Amycolatopsis TaxID=2618356 RepID=UPI003442BD4D
MRGRLAVNPVGYWLTDGVADRSKRVLGAAYTELAEIGFRAVKADVPDDMDAAEYLPWLTSFGPEPAISLYSGTFDDPARHAEQAEAARVFAAHQASFGQAYCMISTFGPGTPRTDRPAVGAGCTAGRLAAVVDGVGQACAAMRSEGVTAALHQHVGGWVETEHEVRTVLGDIGPDLLAFGPNVGHLAWAGVDVPSFLRAYADRIVAVHIKDLFTARITGAATDEPDYRRATRPGRLWAEPGRGRLDLAGCLAALPDRFDGDLMIEVDVPALPLRESHETAYDWALAVLPESVRR